MLSQDQIDKAHYALKNATDIMNTNVGVDRWNVESDVFKSLVSYFLFIDITETPLND